MAAKMNEQEQYIATLLRQPVYLLQLVVQGRMKQFKEDKGAHMAFQGASGDHWFMEEELQEPSYFATYIVGPSEEDPKVLQLSACVNDESGEFCTEWTVFMQPNGEHEGWTVY